MGCFSWLFSGNKKKNRREKKERKLSAKKKAQESPHDEDEIANLKKTTGGVAFEVEIKPAVKPPPPLRHKFVESLQSAEQRALKAAIRRSEEIIRKGEAAKEADRKRKIYLEQKAEKERQFVERAKSSLAKKELPDDTKIQANMAALKKRCKTARTRGKVMTVVAGRGGKDQPFLSAH